VIALRDVKAYGSRFPWNFLVLLSPPSSAVAWFLFHGNYWILVPPLLLYVLGVNVGVFSANLSLRPLLGLSQLPVVVSVLLTWLFPKLLPITLAIYFSLLLYRRKERGIHSLTAPPHWRLRSPRAFLLPIPRGSPTRLRFGRNGALLRVVHSLLHVQIQLRKDVAHTPSFRLFLLPQVPLPRGILGTLRLGLTILPFPSQGEPRLHRAQIWNVQEVP